MHRCSVVPTLRGLAVRTPAWPPGFVKQRVVSWLDVSIVGRQWTIVEGPSREKPRDFRSSYLAAAARRAQRRAIRNAVEGGEAEFAFRSKLPWSRKVPQAFVCVFAVLVDVLCLIPMSQAAWDSSGTQIDALSRAAALEVVKEGWLQFLLAMFTLMFLHDLICITSNARESDRVLLRDGTLSAATKSHTVMISPTSQCTIWQALCEPRLFAIRMPGAPKILVYAQDSRVWAALLNEAIGTPKRNREQTHGFIRKSQRALFLGLTFASAVWSVLWNPQVFASGWLFAGVLLLPAAYSALFVSARIRRRLAEALNRRARRRRTRHTPSIVAEPDRLPDSHIQVRLGRAIMNNDREQILRLIEEGASVDDVEDGMSELMFAIEHERFESVKALVDGGANVNVQTSEGATALHWAIDISCDATIQKKRKLGTEPTDTVEFLLERGANLDLRDHRGQTPLDLARRYGSKKIVAILEAWQRKRADHTDDTSHP